TFDFLIGVFVYNESTQNFEFTNANLTIVAASKTIFTDTLAAITNKVTVNDGYDNYFLSVTKDGYKTWTDTLTAAELKLYFRSEDKGPLKVILEKGCNCPTTVTDIEGNVYETVVIGNQCWMKANLKTTKYNDGTNIPLVIDNATWAALTTPAYCFYNNDEATYKNTYGALYNWYTVNTGKLAPKGWHVPNYDEVSVLVNYVGLIGGGKLKEIGTMHWLSPNTGSTNETGFSALPGGYRWDYGCQDIGNTGRWWSSKEINSINASPWVLYSDGSAIWWFNANGQPKNLGYSVRCIKD
ncbi:MAG: fibrobacter succinogenes major paralogous domain-containing protein, partial [Bacteroidales bacterium]|nr:fibrobacter succinogenes major paralogous domain-containing protein [Bacteroidales bacterium]